MDFYTRVFTCIGFIYLHTENTLRLVLFLDCRMALPFPPELPSFLPDTGVEQNQLLAYGGGEFFMKPLFGAHRVLDNSYAN